MQRHITISIVYFLAAVFTLSVLLFVGDTKPAFANESFKIIVHPGVSVVSISRAELNRVFLKKLTKWPGGTAIKPVDQKVKSPVRRVFSKSILRRSVTAAKTYWRKQIFTGRNVPPPEVLSDKAVIKYVLSKPGAIGYVSVNTPTNGVKVLQVK
ncbi:MAG: hypothetical protein GY847_07120 [Proteobacteria bacterium]|nr:hypothetical protein [Pseudomonadota bacterium]